MNELGQIRTAVLTALKDAGIEALEQFPEEKIKAYTGAAATVGVGAWCESGVWTFAGA